MNNKELEHVRKLLRANRIKWESHLSQEKGDALSLTATKAVQWFQEYFHGPIDRIENNGLTTTLEFVAQHETEFIEYELHIFFSGGSETEFWIQIEPKKPIDESQNEDHWKSISDVWERIQK
ncbi:MAG: hypothetical protein KGN01_08130 [Patescibacteria group bacterium]|nr:hypothetical protein [Patescibacteria group bacterium]